VAFRPRAQEKSGTPYWIVTDNAFFVLLRPVWRHFDGGTLRVWPIYKNFSAAPTFS